MCIFSVGKLFCRCGAGDDASYGRFGETKDKYFNRSLRHGTEICVLIRFSTYRFHRYRCHVGTGFRYPTPPRVSSALKKNYNTKIQNNYQKTGILLYCIIVFVVLFIMHILRNSQLRKLVSDLKKWREKVVNNSSGWLKT